MTPSVSLPSALATTLRGRDFGNQIRTLSCLSVSQRCGGRLDLLHIWSIEEQICPEEHTIDAREADHSYTQEGTINPFS